jgi:hypothetical protein
VTITPELIKELLDLMGPGSHDVTAMQLAMDIERLQKVDRRRRELDEQEKHENERHKLELAEINKVRDLNHRECMCPASLRQTSHGAFAGESMVCCTICGRVVDDGDHSAGGYDG